VATKEVDVVTLVELLAIEVGLVVVPKVKDVDIDEPWIVVV